MIILTFYLKNKYNNICNLRLFIQNDFPIKYLTKALPPMPLIENHNYQPPFLYRNTYFNTIYTALWRPLFELKYDRERVELPNGDFIDLDWSRVDSDNLLLCVHGLEGNARKPYMRAMMHYFNQSHDELSGWDTVGFNLRSCSGEDNRLLGGYHSGNTDDLNYVIDKIIATQIYKKIAIIGFSIGGNIVLKYAGEKGDSIHPIISHVIGFSVPSELKSCSMEFEKPKNWIYLQQFLLSLKPKARNKAQKFPGSFDLKKALAARNFREFDSAYTGPINGFKDCFDYWEKASCLPLLKNITIPTLLINAKDDTFLAPECFPYELAKTQPNFHLEITAKGGHLGFMAPDNEGYLWTERRAWDFVNEDIKTTTLMLQKSKIF